MLCAHEMAGRRAHIILPEELVEEIDQLVGRRGRSAFIARAATAEIKRVRQLNALQKAAGSWKDENHPEIAVGAASWVSHLRKESDERLSNARRR
jgi:metal-responsive CopG/Arc/MetJ family transcriptional regulator